LSLCAAADATAITVSREIRDTRFDVDSGIDFKNGV
jgi:hypothetical protein